MTEEQEITQIEEPVVCFYQQLQSAVSFCPVLFFEAKRTLLHHWSERVEKLNFLHSSAVLQVLLSLPTRDDRDNTGRYTQVSVYTWRHLEEKGGPTDYCNGCRSHFQLPGVSLYSLGCRA